MERTKTAQTLKWASKQVLSKKRFDDYWKIIDDNINSQFDEV